MHRRGSATLAPMQVKATVLSVLDRLPDDCTMEEVLYHLYVVQKIEEGLADIDAGRTIPHEQVVEEFRRKWLLGAE